MCIFNSTVEFQTLTSNLHFDLFFRANQSGFFLMAKEKHDIKTLNKCLFLRSLNLLTDRVLSSFLISFFRLQVVLF